jgi:hypothetical protein
MNFSQKTKMKNSLQARVLRAAHAAYKIKKEQAYTLFLYTNKVKEVVWGDVLRRTWALFKNPISVTYSELGEIDFNF